MDLDDFLDCIDEGAFGLLIPLGVLVGAIAVRWAARSWFRTYGRYGSVPAACGLSGEAVARRLLADCGLPGVAVVRSSGRDLYHPTKREVRLAAANFEGRSLAALAIAAHEVGHAQQFASRGILCRLRRVSWWGCSALTVVALLLLLQGTTVVPLGRVGPGLVAVTAALVALRATVHLTMERDATRRARDLVRRAGLIAPGEQGGFDRVLSAAWLTYVAAESRSWIGLALIALLTAVWAGDGDGDLAPWGGDRVDLTQLEGVAPGPPIAPAAWAAARLLPVVVILPLVVSYVRPGTRVKPAPTRRGAGGHEPAGSSDYRAGLEEAVRRLDEAIALHPDDAFAYVRRGAACSHLGQFDRALADFEHALALDPKEPVAYRGRGVVRTARGELDEALADLDTAIALRDDDAATRAMRGRIRLHRDDHDRAIADLGVATSRAPGDATAWRDLGLARLLSGDVDRAQLDLDEAIRLDPSDPVAFNNRGVARMKGGQYTRAIEDLREAVRLDPAFPNPYRHLAWLQSTCPLAEFRHGEQAVADATRAMDLTEWKRVEWLDVLVAAHAEAGNFEEARRWQAEADKAAPRDPHAAKT